MRSQVFIILAALAPLALDAEIRRDIEYVRRGEAALKLDAAVAGQEGAATPAVILVHGGGWSEGDRSSGIEPLASALSAAGMAWFSIDYRLAPEHVYPASVEDVEAAVDFVMANAEDFRVDRKRLFLAGFSAGGHLAALTAMTTGAASKLAGVISFYGRMDLVRGYEVPGPAVQSIRGLLDLEPSATAGHPLLRAASPIARIRPGLPPFLLVHGTADAVVPVDDSRRMCAALREGGIPCNLIPIAGGGHGMSRWQALDPRPDFILEALRWIGEQPSAPSAQP